MSSEEQIILLREENYLLREENKQLHNLVSKLEQRIIELEDLLRKSNIRKNSSNSSMPPSSDMSFPKRNQSLREKSGKTTGGQFGHKGTTLKMTDTPDEIIRIEPSYCNHCGNSLEREDRLLQSKRQVIEIPPINPIIIEYQNFMKICPNCGHHQQGGYPEGVNNHIQYGSSVEAAISYFFVYQYMPYKRLKECLKHLFNLAISQGSIENVLNRMSLKAEPVYNRIKELIILSKQNGSDETSVKVNGKKWWIWVWQTLLLTYLTCSKSRGSQSIDNEFPDGLKNSILISDRWAAQLKTEALAHQLCIAHLLRDLKYLEQLEKNEWSTRMKELLKESLNLKEKCLECSKDDADAMQLEQRLDILLKEDIPKTTNHKTFAFQKSLMKYRDSIFIFLYNKDTTPDNNGSERSIRNIKVKQKISGQFKTGQHSFCVLRSVIDTCIKNAVDVMDALCAIAKFIPAE